RGVTGPVAAGLPEFLPAGRVEGDDARLFAADVDQHALALDERRGAGPEEVLRHIVGLHEVLAPALLAVLHRPAAEGAVAAEGEHISAGDGGGAASAVALAEVVAVFCGVGFLPDRLAGVGSEALDHLVVSDAVKQDELATGHGDGGVALADVALPGDSRP